MLAKRISQLAFLGLFLGVGAHAIEVKTEVDLATTISWNDEHIYEVIYLSPDIRLSDRWHVIGELYEALELRQGGESKTSLTHNYLRFTAQDDGLGKLGDWRFKMNYRYSLPTTESQQLSGSMGEIRIGPSFKRDFGAFDLKFWDGVYLWVQRNAYQTHTSSNPQKYAAPKGNKLFGNVVGVESVIQTGIKGLYFDVQLNNYNWFAGKAPGQTTADNEFYVEQDVSIRYDFPETGLTNGLTLQLGQYGFNQYGQGKNLELYKSVTDNEIYFNIVYVF